MSGDIKLLGIYPNSFRASIYTKEPFRMIGLIDVSINYIYGKEIVTLAYYRSSGTNNNKIKGLWYPIVGIKTRDGTFTEFTEYLNYVLTNTTRSKGAHSGWLAKSLYFSDLLSDNSKLSGFSNGRHYELLLETGKSLRYLFDNNDFYYMNSLNAKTLNNLLTTKEIYLMNKHTQRENYERFIEDIFMEYR